MIKRAESSSRAKIGATLRELRTERRFTQAELAARLRVSQAHLSEIERGESSLTAEGLLEVLRIFNVGVKVFARGSKPTTELQNALARWGARHLVEADDVVAPDELDELDRLIATTLANPTPRLLGALAPVVVQHIDRLDLRGLRISLEERGLGQRLDWLLDNTREALVIELGSSVTASWGRKYRRALLVIETFLSTQTAAPEERIDILDRGIRSQETLRDVREGSSAIARRWGVVTSLAAEDFASALRAVRETD